MPALDAVSRVRHVEKAFAADINHNIRFRPYLALHEFEALVFASLDACSWVFGDDEKVLQSLKKERSGFATPEHINEGAATSPSKRILKASRTYRKTSDGPMATEEAGLPVLRASCPHFGEWLTWLESLSPREAEPAGGGQ